MPVSFVFDRLRQGLRTGGIRTAILAPLLAAGIGACVTVAPSAANSAAHAAPPRVTASASEPEVVSGPPLQNADRIDIATAADQVARRVLQADADVRAMSTSDLVGAASQWAAQVAADDPAATPGAAINLALVLAREGGGANLDRASALLTPIVHGGTPELQAWQPMASMLADRIDAERRLQSQVDRQTVQAAQDQHQIDRLTEKLNALKAIELSMSPSAAATLKAHGRAGPPAAANGRERGPAGAAAGGAASRPPLPPATPAAK